jgi:hypothetical protein
MNIEPFLIQNEMLFQFFFPFKANKVVEIKHVELNMPWFFNYNSMCY